MLTRRRVIAAKIEAAEGTMEAIVVADSGLLAIDPKFDADFKTNNRDDVKTNTLSKMIPVPGAQSGKITFRTEIKGTGSAYAAANKPVIGTFLRGCGFAETVDATAGVEKVTYLPASTGIPSLTIWLYEDGMIKKLKGCRGNVKFSGKTGEIVYADFEFTGVYGGIVDGAMISPTFDLAAPPVVLGTTMTIDGYTGVCESFSFDMATTLQLRGSAGSTEGFLSCLLTDRKPSGKLDPEMVLAATYDFFAKWKAGGAGALTVGPVGGTQYNKFTFTAPKCVYTKVGDGDRNGNQIADLDFLLAMNSGDDELKLEFT